MNCSAETFLTDIGTWTDQESGLSVAPASIESGAFKVIARYDITDDESVVGRAQFEYVPDCDTVFFLSIELDPGVANQGFMTRWLEYGAVVMSERQVRRASSSPVGYAAQVFDSAGWQANTEDSLGRVCAYYSQEEADD